MFEGRLPGKRTVKTVSSGEKIAGKALDIYLDDHLAGSTLGCGLAEQFHARNEGTPLGDLMASLAVDIANDRQTLVDLMDRMGTVTNPVKKGTALLAEKASHVKFGGMTSGNPALGTFLALETLALGVEGKICLWRSLKAIGKDHAVLASVNFDQLIERGEAQHGALERQRMAWGVGVLQDGVGPEERSATTS